MKKRMRFLSVALAAALVVGSIPAVPLTAEASGASDAGGQGVRLQAEEVEGYSRLDEREVPANENRVQPQYQADEMVTVIVEMEDAPLMDYYGASTYAAEQMVSEEVTAGEAVSAFLNSDDAKVTSGELLAGQNTVLASIEEMALDSQPAVTSADGAEETEGLEVLDRWTSVTNAAAIRVPYRLLKDIRRMDGVKRAYVEHVYDRPEPVENSALTELTNTEGISYNLAGVTEAWKDGYTGKGMLVAVMDSGLDIEWGPVTDENYEVNYQVKRTHEAFREDSFYSGDPTDKAAGWDLRYTGESLAAFLEENQLCSTTGADGNKITYDNNALFKNIKVPYAADYADGDVNVLPTNSDHGTHVSGTVAGYAETAEGEIKFTGVAPDAQILFFKVFPDADGGAQESTLINALDDAMKLGADLVNLSLGADNGYAEDDTLQNDMYLRVGEAGIAMMTSAGNSGYSAANDNYSSESLSTNPEISMMSAPAIYSSNMSVASLDNMVSVQSYFTWKDTDENGSVVERKIYFQDPYSVAMKADFSDQEYPVYAVGGCGSYGDFANVGFNNGWNNGKTGIALVKRGEISFADKINNAANFSSVNSQGERFGVKAVIVYDSDPNGTELINMNVEGTTLDSCFISGKDGAAIVAALEAGKEVRIRVSAEDEVVDYATGGQMSSYSSWGAGPGLELDPEITAPGGNIWSTIIDPNADRLQEGETYNGGYGMMSGTSMAAPHMTGIAALVRQYITTDPKFAAVPQSKQGDVISQLLASTAIPQKEPEGTYYSPRQQGAGLVNAGAAVETPAYLSVEGKRIAKLEFKDDPQKRGEYHIAFDINNVSDTEVSYNVKAVLLRPDTKTVDSEWGEREAMSISEVELSETDLGTVTVAGKSTESFSGDVSLTEEQKAEMNSLFANGTYVEGYVILTDANADTEEMNPQLGLPMLGFYGDWTAAPIFDSANWYDDPGEDQNFMTNECTWSPNIVGSMLIAGSEVIGFLNIGQNVFDSSSTDEQLVYEKENFTISPNGDGYLDMIDDYIIYQLRNARLVVIEVKDRKTGDVYFRDWASYAFKTVYDASYAIPIPFSLYGTFPTWDGTDQEGNPLPSGTQCDFTITAYGDGEYGDEVYNEQAGYEVTDFDSIIPGEKEPTFNGHAMDMTGDVISFPITVDTVAPKLVNNAVTCYEKDGRTYIKGTVNDPDGSIASIEIDPIVIRRYKEGYGDASYQESGPDMSNPFYVDTIYDPAKKTSSFEVDVTGYSHAKESYPGENYYYDFEWTGNILLSCGDYGANDRSYAIKVDPTPGLVLSQTSALLHPGNVFELSVNNNAEDSDLEITRTSSNPKVATVDEYGMVTAVAPGQAYITVSNGVDSAVCVVAVEKVNTVVEDFKLSLESVSGLKPGCSATVKVTDLKPADVELTEIKWETFEDEEYAEQYAAGQLTVEKNTADSLSGNLRLYNTVSYGAVLPAGHGQLKVTLNGVSRTMDVNWEAAYTDYSQEDIIPVGMGHQVHYVHPGESVILDTRYRQSSGHDTGAVVTEGMTGLRLDGPDFFLAGSGRYQARLVNDAGYALPDSVEVYHVYSAGETYESRVKLTEGNIGYNDFTYDKATGAINIYAPYGASCQILIVANGVVSEGAAAGEMSGQTYPKPDGLYGPFKWTLTEGSGTLESAEGVNYGVTYPTEKFTADAPGVNYIKAETTDGKYSLEYVVVCEPVKADTLELNTHRIDMKKGETAELTATLAPEPSLETDRKVTYKSYNRAVAKVDENGVITAVGEGYAYIQVCSEADNRVESYCVVYVEPYAQTMLDQAEAAAKAAEEALAAAEEARKGAEEARQQAAADLAAAGEAKQEALAAQAAAETAQAAAEEAQRAAAEAKAEAEALKAAAEAAKGDSEAARDEAAALKAAAEQQVAAAEAAQAAAEEASAVAEASKKAAEEARSQAQTYLAEAEEKVTAAQSALKSAEAARDAALAAQTAAEQLKNTAAENSAAAEAAKTAALQAKEDALKAKEEAAGLKASAEASSAAAAETLKLAQAAKDAAEQARREADTLAQSAAQQKAEAAQMKADAEAAMKAAQAEAEQIRKAAEALALQKAEVEAAVKAAQAAQKAAEEAWAKFQAAQKAKVTIKTNKKVYKVKAGKKVRIKAKASDGSKVTFVSRNKKVARVTKKGVVKGLKKGRAVIVLKAGKVTKKVKVRVTK